MTNVSAAIGAPAGGATAGHYVQRRRVRAASVVPELPDLAQRRMHRAVATARECETVVSKCQIRRFDGDFYLLEKPEKHGVRCQSGGGCERRVLILISRRDGI